LLHELAHSLVATANKLPVKEITLFALGGVSQIEKNPLSAVGIAAGVGLVLGLLLRRD